MTLSTIIVEYTTGRLIENKLFSSRMMELDRRQNERMEKGYRRSSLQTNMQKEVVKFFFLSLRTSYEYRRGMKCINIQKIDS